MNLSKETSRLLMAGHIDATSCVPSRRRRPSALPWAILLGVAMFIILASAIHGAAT